MEKNTKKKKIVLPVVPLRGKVAFPGTIFSFDAGRPGTIEAIKISSSQYNGEILICTQKDTDKNDVAAEDMYSVGTVAEIKQVTNLPGGAVRVVAEGQRAVKVKAFTLTDCFYAECAERKTVHGDPVIEEAYLRSARALVADVLISEGKLNKETVAKLDLTADADEYVNAVVNAMRVRLDVKQRILEETDAVERLKLLEQCLNDELEISKIEKRISSAVRQSIERSQKDYYLREQLKAIHGELGDDGKEQDKYREKAEEKHLPDYMREKFLKEVDRLDKMQPSSPEYTVVTSYLDQVLELPWTEETKDTDKLSDAAAILNEDHYALEKIKDRICEYLAVLKLTGNMKAPILCFVGPPGVGKTSIARSIARALGRKFVRMSLGGVKDEAEIRGHRRTYIGAMPGRILYAMKSAGTINPVILLDEIDKISSDMRGDPAGALLEVLDPEQNNSFRDRYLEEPYDLSKVLFVTTANTLDTIPAPLLDRMEVIELSGYTLEEKKEIARSRWGFVDVKLPAGTPHITDLIQQRQLVHLPRQLVHLADLLPGTVNEHLLRAPAVTCRHEVAPRRERGLADRVLGELGELGLEAPEEAAHRQALGDLRQLCLDTLEPRGEALDLHLALGELRPRGRKLGIGGSKLRPRRFELLGLLVQLGLNSAALGLVFGHGLVPPCRFPLDALLAPRKAVQRPYAPVEPVLHRTERRLVREEPLPRELAVPQRHETEVGVRGLLVHVHREVHQIRLPELLAAKPERVLEEAPHLLGTRALEELRACRHDALDEPHGILAHLAGALVALVNPRLHLALVVGVRAHLAVQPGSGFGVRMPPARGS